MLAAYLTKDQFEAFNMMVDVKILIADDDKMSKLQIGRRRSIVHRFEISVSA